MGYVLNEKLCSREAYFEDGEIISHAQWEYWGERMTGFDTDYGELDVRCRWYRDGRMEEYHLDSHHSLALDFFIHFSAEGLIERLRLSERTLSALDTAASGAPFCPVTGAADLFKLRGATDVLLLGEGIVADFLMSPSAAEVLGETGKIQLWSDHLESLDPYLFVKLPRLRALELKLDPGHVGIAYAIKNVRPDLRVLLDGRTSSRGWLEVLGHNGGKSPA